MRRTKRKKGGLLVFAAVLILIGYAAAVYPFALMEAAKIRQSVSIGETEGAVREMDEGKKEEIREEMDAYNRELMKAQEKVPFSYAGQDAPDPVYASLPVPGDDIGSVEIPVIGVDLPIAHGTSDAVLQAKAGHMYGTSLPVGGASTHACIAAHSALASSELFTHLDRLEEGDVFYIHILGEIHAYTVRKVRIVKPEAADAYLGIRKGGDLVTLYTCTPYGINTHRLLVTGERTPEKDGYADLKAGGAEQASLHDYSARAAAKLMLFAGFPAGVIICVLAGRVQKRRKLW